MIGMPGVLLRPGTGCRLLPVMYVVCGTLIGSVRAISSLERQASAAKSVAKQTAKLPGRNIINGDGPPISMPR